MFKKLIGMGLVATTATVAALAALGGVGAHATTSNETGLPDPPVELSKRIGVAYVGRYYLKRVPRSANIRGAVMDIVLITEAAPNFYYGKVDLSVYNKHGALEPKVLLVWWFQYHSQTNVLTARLIPPTTVSSTNQDGTKVGQLAFQVPGGQTGLANGGKELKTLSAKITLNGHTFPATFQRSGEGEQGAVVLSIPPAEVYGH